MDLLIGIMATGISREDIRVALAIGLTFVLTVVMPTVWLAAKRRPMEKFVRAYYPFAAFVSALTGIAASSATVMGKIVLGGVAAVVSLVGGALAYRAYRLLKRFLKL
ncbi:MAG: hypothetical protein HY535_04135 [Chloroflexi bacterium]|nr:hypothetical protein [Chloroflexota bacterium]